MNAVAIAPHGRCNVMLGMGTVFWGIRAQHELCDEFGVFEIADVYQPLEPIGRQIGFTRIDCALRVGATTRSALIADAYVWLPADKSQIGLNSNITIFPI